MTLLRVAVDPSVILPLFTLLFNYNYKDFTKYKTSLQKTLAGKRDTSSRRSITPLIKWRDVRDSFDQGTGL